MSHRPAELLRRIARCFGQDRGRTTIERLEAEVVAQADIIRRQDAARAARETTIGQSLDRAKIGIWECRLFDNALTWTQSTYDLFDMPHGMPITRSQILALYHPESEAALAPLRARSIAERRSFDLDVRVRTALGAERRIRIRANVECERDRAVRLFGTKQDVTHEMIAMERLRRQADSDPLTNLANRRRFTEVLSAALCQRSGALLLIDLDGFKQINDVHGHRVGDACLREVAVRLRRAFSHIGHVGRLGGDEFAVVIGDGADLGTVEIRVGLFLVAMTRPFQLEGRTLHLGASIGIAPFLGRQALDTSTIYDEADSALYAAKAMGKAGYRVYAHGSDGRMSMPVCGNGEQCAA